MPKDHAWGSSKGRARKREYNASCKRAEQELEAVQRALQEQQQQQYEQIQEKNMILAELIYVQERTTAVYERHKRWLAAGGPTELENQQQLQQRVRAQIGAHWVLYLLETATWEQLQLALSWDCEDWINYLNKYFKQLCYLAEINRREPEMQAQLLQAAGVNPQPHVPVVYSIKGAYCTTPAWTALIEAMQTGGVPVFLALLHGSRTLFDAASRHAGTGQHCTAPHLHWATLAKRMRFSRQQKQHFKLALQVGRV